MSAHPAQRAMGTHVKNFISTMRQFCQRHIVKLLLVVVLFVIALTTYLKLMYSPDQCVRQFITAIDSHDYQTLETFVICDDENIEILEETLHPFVNLYHADAQFRQDIHNTLKHDLSQVNLDTYNNEYWNISIARLISIRCDIL